VTNTPPFELTSDARKGIETCPVIRWHGEVWRAHNRRYAGNTTDGSRLYSGRYNRGIDSFPDHQDWGKLARSGLVWEALYTGLSWGVCLAETMRHLDPGTWMAYRRNLRLSLLRLDLEAVLDATDLSVLKIDEDDLLHDSNYRIGQALAEGTRGRKCDGLLVPSATRIPGEEARCLIVFPDFLAPNSQIRVIRTVDPNFGGNQETSD
jgi:hypothetical protein